MKYWRRGTWVVRRIGTTRSTERWKREAARLKAAELYVHSRLPGTYTLHRVCRGRGRVLVLLSPHYCSSASSCYFYYYYYYYFCYYYYCYYYYCYYYLYSPLLPMYLFSFIPFSFPPSIFVIPSFLSYNLLHPSFFPFYHSLFIPIPFSFFLRLLL